MIPPETFVHVCVCVCVFMRVCVLLAEQKNPHYYYQSEDMLPGITCVRTLSLWKHGPVGRLPVSQVMLFT